MASEGKPLGVVSAAGGWRGVCDAAGVEAEFGGFGEDLLFGAFGVHGSRSKIAVSLLVGMFCFGLGGILGSLARRLGGGGGCL